MSNFNTITAITDNLETVLKGLGLNFTTEDHETVAAIPASILPHGQIFYHAENFEYNHGERPGYTEAEFLLRLVFNRERSPRETIRQYQKWGHNIRDGLTINSLNIGGIAASKLVSRVETVSATPDDSHPDRGVVNYTVRIRYREV